jgi:putative peptidoglycan lipid II flippase
MEVVAAIEGETPTSTARNSATVAAWTLISRATGLLRVLVIGAVDLPISPTAFRPATWCRA